jgi:predicted translin family RNA/ssDNA-binding protein
MAEDKVCECIESLREFIAHTTDAITFGMEHDFATAKRHIDSAEKALDKFEKCSAPTAPFDATREFISKAKKALDEYKDVEAKEHLGLAQWNVFREVRDKVCPR